MGAGEYTSQKQQRGDRACFGEPEAKPADDSKVKVVKISDVVEAYQGYTFDMGKPTEGTLSTGLPQTITGRLGLFLPLLQMMLYIFVPELARAIFYVAW